MIDPVVPNDDLTAEARCAFTGCPALLHAAVRRTRLDVAADAILDACAVMWRPIEWMLLGAVLYVALAG